MFFTSVQEKFGGSGIGLVCGIGILHKFWLKLPKLSFVGGRHNQSIERTRVALVKDSKCARTSLAHFELCTRRPRAADLGR